MISRASHLRSLRDRAIAGDPAALLLLEEIARSASGAPGAGAAAAGDSAAALYPPFQGLAGAGDEMAAYQVPSDFVFRSDLPVLGPLVAWARAAVYSLASRWAVRHFQQEQARYNAAGARGWQDMIALNRQLACRVAELQQRVAELERRPAPPAVPRPGRRRIAYWSPLPPVASGISDYSESLLERLAPAADVDVYVDGYYPEHGAGFAGLDVLDGSAFPERHRQRPYDACLFQLGNHPAHTYQYRPLLSRACPAIGVLHDGSLYHMLLPLFSPQELAEEAGYCDGPPARERLLAQQRAGGVQAFDYALLRRAVEACDGLITHSQGLARRCRALRPGLAVDVVPMGAECYDPRPPEAEAAYRRRLRGWLGFPVDGILFGAFGQMTPAKRLAEIVRAFRAARPAGASLCLFGQATDSTPPEVAALLRDPRAARDEGIWVAGAAQVSYEALLLAMQSVDAAFSLRRPTTGEASAVVAGLLGMGVPTAVTDAGWFSELPDDAVLKIPDATDEVEAVAEAMQRLAGDALLRQRLSQAARQYARGCAWPVLAERCLSALERAAA